MKKILKSIITLGILSCLLSLSAQALTIQDNDAVQYGLNGTDVGGADTLIASTNTLGNSGTATETAWAADILGIDINDLTLVFKEENFNGADQIFSTNDSDKVAFQFNPTPGPNYFLIKKGSGQTGSHILYNNLANVDWGVFSLSEIDGLLVPFFPGNSINEENITISHYTSFNGAVANTPDTGATIALLGLSLAGLGILKRRK